MTRRNLSGIYIFEQFDDEQKASPTCFEECSEETQDKWLDSLDEAALKRLAKQLAETLKEIGNAFDITTA